MDDTELKAVLEGLLFIAGDEGLTVKQLANVLEMTKEEAKDLADDLQADYERQRRGLKIAVVAGAYQLTTRPEHAPYFTAFAVSPNASTLSQAALETLAIVAYKQPITRAEIEDIRGVKSERPLHTLSAKRLIKEVGRAEGIGRPILYGTTEEFLTSFGLQSLEALPPLDETVDREDVEAEHEELFAKLAPPSREE
ncbi:SMC-Scp complex subunit ScpB [Numidum massiliense]|uniref:SMC-Scp complex subunit ScpB n=1 Tax=Numidum massiliense TaxID=1522315 RepID=UPI0006D59023|nr:SMC-Scp complex subunit ScpB [Numidum massiliense]